MCSHYRNDEVDAENSQTHTVTMCACNNKIFGQFQAVESLCWFLLKSMDTKGGVKKSKVQQLYEVGTEDLIFKYTYKISQY